MRKSRCKIAWLRRKYVCRAIVRSYLTQRKPHYDIPHRIGGRMSDSGTKQKNVLITGATDGLGRAAAVLLAQRGYRVFAAGRSAEKRRDLDELARQQKLALETLDMDVCDDASVSEGVTAVIAKAGSVDVLINNAGIIYV